MAAFQLEIAQCHAALVSAVDRPARLALVTPTLVLALAMEIAQQDRIHYGTRMRVSRILALDFGEVIAFLVEATV